MISPAALSAPAPAFDVRHFIRKRHYQVNMRQMVAQIVGCAETAEAWRCLGPDEVRVADNVEPEYLCDLSFPVSGSGGIHRGKGNGCLLSVVQKKKRVLYLSKKLQHRKR